MKAPKEVALLEDPMKYNDLIRDMSNKFNLRLEIVRFAREHGVSEAAREFETTRRTVRKWRDRYESDHTRGLLDRPRAPHHIGHKMSESEEQEIVDLRERHKRRWGPKRLKEHYLLRRSEGAIYRVIKQKGLTKKRLKKWQRRQDLREKKARMKAFEKVQTDTKDLRDIPEYYEAMVAKRLPKYQYGVRVMAIGATFFAYADELSLTYTTLFARRVIEHLQSYGIAVEEMEEQTDNGSEYIGSVRAKGPSAYQKVLADAGIVHTRIPPRHCTWQSDIERFNGLIEEEFYMCEPFEDREDFLAKAYAYQLFFNYGRKNRWRDRKTPVELLREKMPKVDEQVLNLPPIRLETLLATGPTPGYHVPDSVNFFKL
jgi:transposase InsO family protein